MLQQISPEAWSFYMHINRSYTVRDFRPPPRSRYELRSSGLLRSE